MIKCKNCSNSYLYEHEDMGFILDIPACRILGILSEQKILNCDKDKNLKEEQCKTHFLQEQKECQRKNS